MLSIKNKKFLIFFICSCILLNCYINLGLKNVLALKYTKIRYNLKDQNVLSSETINEFDSYNPWKSYMEIFNIPHNHGAGVYEDLKGNIPIPNFFFKSVSKYRYPAGECPVFGKILEIEYNSNHTAFLGEILMKHEYDNAILETAKEGNLPNLDTHAIEGGLSFFPPADVEHNRFKSPIDADSINDCAQHAASAETVARTLTEGVGNCVNNTRQQCIKQPFAYDLIKKKCFLIFPTFQSSSKTEIVFNPVKDSSLSHIVYGSASIRPDWQDFCPVRPLKGVVFGKWSEGKCVEINKMFKNKKYELSNPTLCGAKLFEKSPNDHPIINYKVSLQFESDGIGFNWANYENGVCLLINEAPDCLIYSQDSYAFTSTGLINTEFHDLPPCISESVGWKIVAKCGNDIDDGWSLFHCKSDGYWHGLSNKIKKCEPTAKWLNFSANDYPGPIRPEDNYNKDNNSTYNKKNSSQQNSNEGSGTSPLLIAGSVFGAVTLLGAAGAGAYTYFKAKEKNSMDTDLSGSVEDQRTGDYDKDENSANWVQDE